MVVGRGIDNDLVWNLSHLAPLRRRVWNVQGVRPARQWVHAVALCLVVTANPITLEIGWYGLLDPLTTAAVQVSELPKEVISHIGLTRAV